MDGWQGATVKALGEDPNTPDLLSRNRITPTVMDNTATRVGQVYNDVAGRTTIGKNATNGVVNTMATIDGDLDTAAIGDAQKTAIRRTMDIVQNAAANGNNTISGADYLASD